MASQGRQLTVGVGGNIQRQPDGRSAARPQAGGKTSTAGGSCDIVLVIDTTGSMSDKIQGLLEACGRFVDEIATRQMDWRIAVVAFGDLTVRGDKIVATSFSHNVEVVKDSLRRIPHFSGGGNEGESSLEALGKALGLGGYRTNAMKAFIMLTDEPALQHNLKPKDITQRLVEAGALTFVISTDRPYYREMAEKTGGKWFEIASNVQFLSILDELIERVGATLTDVQELAGGDVGRYLQLQGGGNVEACIIRWIIAQFEADEGIDLSLDAMAMQRVNEAAAIAESALLTAEETEVRLPFIHEKKHFRRILTRGLLSRLRRDAGK